MMNTLFTAHSFVQPSSHHNNVGGAFRIRQQSASKIFIQTGFTLIELMIVIVIAGILAAIALPNLSNFIANGRVSSAANDLVSDLMLARSLASSSNRAHAVICPAAIASTAKDCSTTVACSSNIGDWASLGRIVFIDNHTTPSGTPNGSCQNGDLLIKHTNAIASGSITTPAASTNNWITFNSYGAMNPIGTRSFRLCVTGASQCRLITVNFSGRPSVTKVD